VSIPLPVALESVLNRAGLGVPISDQTSGDVENVVGSTVPSIRS